MVQSGRGHQSHEVLALGKPRFSRYRPWRDLRRQLVPRGPDRLAARGADPAFAGVCLAPARGTNPAERDGTRTVGRDNLTRLTHPCQWRAVGLARASIDQLATLRRQRQRCVEAVVRQLNNQVDPSSIWDACSSRRARGSGQLHRGPACVTSVNGSISAIRQWQRCDGRYLMLRGRSPMFRKMQGVINLQRALTPSNRWRPPCGRSDRRESPPTLAAHSKMAARKRCRSRKTIPRRFAPDRRGTPLDLLARHRLHDYKFSAAGLEDLYVSPESGHGSWRAVPIG